jgi:hypothetical protein
VYCAIAMPRAPDVLGASYEKHDDVGSENGTFPKVQAILAPGRKYDAQRVGMRAENTIKKAIEASRFVRIVRQRNLRVGGLGIEQALEAVWVNRLDKMCMKTSASGSPTVVIVTVSSDGHKQCPGERGVAAQTLGHLAAIDAGHGQVAQHHVGAEVVGLNQGGEPVEGGVRFVTPDANQRAQNPCGVLVIIDHEYPETVVVGLHRILRS